MPRLNPSTPRLSERSSEALEISSSLCSDLQHNMPDTARCQPEISADPHHAQGAEEQAPDKARYGREQGHKQDAVWR